ncbi:translocation/assembly module TamB domain-containing protein [Tumidithrix elongata RA019]|uniref:Translocation/assembly module TamB domain-containing protein n=1 Tax=Tumidithrix elongata BACA0141 TaxID=2716417 RepID=A0AAW9PV88_9CYAN|nr:translocation/assembly module TamB domain-containing protein [Tumidithrix elongata RA019]
MGQQLLPPTSSDSPTHSFLRNVGRVGVGVALTLTASGLGLCWYGRYFLNERLSPLLQAELTKVLKRPVQLGKIERVSLTSLRFGQSQIPATDKEPNFLVVDAIDVRLDPLTYLQKRQLGLDAVVKSPQVFLKQDLATGNFLPKITPPEKPSEEGFIDLRTVKFEDGQVTIQAAATKEFVTLTQLQLQSDWKITDLSNQSMKLSGGGSVVLPQFTSTTDTPDPEQLRRAINAAKTDKGTIDTKVDWDLTRGQGNIQVRSQNLLASSFQSFLSNIPVSPQKGQIDSEINIAIRAGEDTPDIQGSAKFKDISLSVANLTKPFTNISGSVVFDGKTTTFQQIVGNFGALGVKANGIFNNKSGFNLDLSLEPTDIASVLKDFEVKSPVAVSGEFKASAKVTGTLNKPQAVATLSASNNAKPITVDRVVFNQILAQAELKGLNLIQFKNIKAIAAVGGTIQGEGQIRFPTEVQKGEKQAAPQPELLFAFNLAGVTAENFAALYKTELPIKVGGLTAAVQISGLLSNPQILAQFDAPQATYPASGEVLIADNVATIRNTSVLFPIGAIAVSGTYNLAGGAWQAQLTSSGIPISAFAAGQKGTVEGVLNLNSPSGSFAPTNITANADLRLPQGIAAIPDPITANLAWDGKDLLVPNLQVGGYLTAQGRVNLAFDAQKMPNGIAGLDLDLNSHNVSVSRLASFVPALSGQTSGVANFNGKLAGAIDNLQIAGALRLDNVSLPPLAAAFLAQSGMIGAIPSNGVLSFNGTINGAVSSPKLAGSLRLAGVKINQVEFDSLTFSGAVDRIVSASQISGDVQLNGLKVNQVSFDPRLVGRLDFDLQQGLALDIRGNRDRIAARLDSRFQPLDFSLRLGDATATGSRVGEDGRRLNVAVKDVPLALVASMLGQDNVDGKLSSQLVVDYGNLPSAIGEVVVERPRFGRVLADRLVAKVLYSNGTLEIKDGKLQVKGIGSTEYKFSLAYNPAADVELRGQVDIDQGKVQDILATLQWADFSDVARGITLPKARAALLQPVRPIGVVGVPLNAQLQYLAQLQSRKDQQETNAANNNTLPALSEFKGQLNGSVQFSRSKQDGLRVGFNLVGKQFEYGKFAVDNVAMKGQFLKNVLSLETVKLQSGNSLGQITNARVGLLEQSGKIELVNFPIEALRPLPIFNAIPVDITGNVNGTAVIAGNLFNPQASGKLTLADASINRQPIESVGGEFAYNNGRLNFKALMRVSGPEALNISGDVPLRLPFALVSPGNKIALNINVRNEGLGFINVLNQPVRWVNGIGSASLIVSGTTRSPIVEGKILLDKAVIQVAGLPGDLTDVQGEVTFSSDRFKSDLKGKFSDGNLAAKGVIAISDRGLIKEGSQDFANPLQVTAERLKLNIRDISSNNFNGTLLIKGAALSPILSGEIQLADGRFVITDQAPDNNQDSEVPDVSFDKLMVKLQDMQVTRAPLFNFLTEGNLEVNGSLRDIRPAGRIKVTRGQFNAISARFRLDRSYDNYAEFTPAQGLNPNLNVRVAGSVPELTRIPIANQNPINAFNPNEVPVSNLGSQKTLKVQATVTGNANNPNVTLTSSPPRNQSEILAAIGGGLLQGGADPTASLANLAGGTIINFLQDTVGDALSLAEFNLTPTTSDPKKGGTTTLGLAAEAAIDLSNNFSASLRAVINDPSQPTTYGIRYRLNPNTLIRANTDSQGNTGAAIEFEARF